MVVFYLFVFICVCVCGPFVDKNFLNVRFVLGLLFLSKSLALG